MPPQQTCQERVIYQNSQRSVRRVLLKETSMRSNITLMKKKEEGAVVKLDQFQTCIIKKKRQIYHRFQ